jgi:hypothetical protein
MMLAATAATMNLAQGCTSPHYAQPAGQTHSVTVYPVTMLNQPSPEVAEVVALLLERGGLEDVQLAKTPFSPDPDATFDDLTKAFATFAAGHPMETDYALYSAYLGTPQTGVDEIRGVLVDGSGKVVWTDRQTRNDDALKRAHPTDPMDCSVLLVQRLRSPLGLGDPTRPGAPEGKMAEYWRVKSMAPTKAEREQMKQRLEDLRASAPDVKVLVYPTRVGDEWDAEGARKLADRINKVGYFKAIPVDEPLEFRIKPSSNEQKVLWSGARSIQALVRERKPDADYILVADEMISLRNNHVMAVHWYLLEADGDWVVTDFQNSHHKDFKLIKPKSREDCDALIVARLKQYLK